MLITSPRDHFDKEVEASLRRDLPIITTPHAKSHLTGKDEGENFSNVYDLDFFDTMMVDVKKEGGQSGKSPAIKVTGMPGKHVPSGVLGTLNDLVKAVCWPIGYLWSNGANSQKVPPTNGWMVELGHTSTGSHSEDSFKCGYR